LRNAFFSSAALHAGRQAELQPLLFCTCCWASFSLPPFLLAPLLCWATLGSALRLFLTFFPHNQGRWVSLRHSLSTLKPQWVPIVTHHTETFSAAWTLDPLRCWTALLAFNLPLWLLSLICSKYKSVSLLPDCYVLKKFYYILSFMSHAVLQVVMFGSSLLSD
jgi:hypothetical protein